MKLSAFHIKTTLMSYFRFKRQWICVDEVRGRVGELADVIVDTGSEIKEIEIKISKHDLWKGEAIKSKHKFSDEKRWPNCFYICVPTELIDEAKKWIEQTNPKYGLIEFNSKLFEERGYRNYLHYLTFLKKAKTLHPNYKQGNKDKIAKRLCSALITKMENIIYQLDSKDDKGNKS